MSIMGSDCPVTSRTSRIRVARHSRRGARPSCTVAGQTEGAAPRNHHQEVKRWYVWSTITSDKSLYHQQSAPAARQANW
jgi:hypothetical protein